MKKIVVFTLIIIGEMFLVQQNLFPEEKQENVLKFSYRFEEPRISSAEEFQRIKVAGLKQYEDVGKPILPCKTVKILMPYGRTFGGIEVTTSSMEKIAGTHFIEPGQSSYNSQTERIPPDPEIYSSDKAFPSEVFKVVTLQNKRGYLILFINLFPVRYIPSQRKLTWCREINVEISTRPAPVAGGYRGLAKDKRLIAGQVENREIADTYLLKQQSQ